MQIYKIILTFVKFITEFSNFAHMLRCKNPVRRLPVAMVIFAGLSFALMSAELPLLADDALFRLFKWKPDFLTFARGHIFEANSRMADLLAPFILNMPRICIVLLNGTMCALFFYMLPRAAGLRADKPLARLAVMLLAAVTFGWEYLRMQLLPLINYVWSAAIVLVMLTAATQGNGRRGGLVRILLVPLCLLTGALHEASAIVLLTGIPLHLLLSPRARRYAPARLAMLAALWLGAFFPMDIFTVTESHISAITFGVRTSLWLSGAWPFILIGSIILLAIVRPRELRRLIRSPWLIYAWGGIISLAVGIAAGFPGRPFWYAQVFSLVALAAIPQVSRPLFPLRLRRVLCFFLSAAFMAWFTILTAWQMRGCREGKLILSLYQESPDGVVYADPTYARDIPEYARGLVWSVPDAGENWVIRGIPAFYPGSGYPFKLLPEEMKRITFDSLRLGLRVRGFSAYDPRYVPAPDVRFSSFDTRRMVKVGDNIFVEHPVPLRQRRPGRYNVPVMIVREPLSVQFHTLDSYTWDRRE